MTEQPERTWTDAQVQPILRRFAATRETMSAILHLLRENLESEAAYAVLSHAAPESITKCGVCDGTGILPDAGRLRCPNCKGIGRLVRGS